MKLKKLFAGIVAVAMMATMAMPGFAAKPNSGKTSDVNNGGTVSIELKYTGNGWATDATGLDVGTGKAYAMENTSLTGDAKTAAMNLTISDASTKTATEGVATRNELKIQLPTYANVGTYYYKVKQVASTANGMTHDTKDLVLMVHVINNNKDDLSDTGLKCKVAVLDADPLADGTTPTKISSLTNTYTSATYTAKKVVKGSLGDRDQTFSFRVTFTKAEGKAVSGKIMMTLPGQSPVELTPTWAGDKTYTTSVFTMKHGQTATFANVPKDVTVVVDEMNGNDAVADDTDFTVNGNTYHVTYEHKSVTMTGEDATATVTNRSTTNVDTGVILDNAPYIALLTIVAAGAVVMIMKKRRNYED